MIDHINLPIVIINVRTFCAYILHRRKPAASMEPDIVTGRQPYLFTNEDEIGPLKDFKLDKMDICCYHFYRNSFCLPEHKVIPTNIDKIHAVYPFPSLKSFKNSTYMIPNEYVIPSA